MPVIGVFFELSGTTLLLYGVIRIIIAIKKKTSKTIPGILTGVGTFLLIIGSLFQPQQLYLYKDALRNYDQKNYHEAHRILSKINKNSPDYYEAMKLKQILPEEAYKYYMSEAGKYIAKGDYSSAISFIEKALYWKPQDSTALILLKEISIKKRGTTETESFYVKLLKKQFERFTEGSVLLTLNISIKNKRKKEKFLSPASFKLKDAKGNEYNLFEFYIEGIPGIMDAAIKLPPQISRNIELTFEVPTEAEKKHLMLIIKAGILEEEVILRVQ